MDSVRVVWTVGGAEDESVLLRSLGGAGFGPGGRVAVADLQLPGVYVLDSRGAVELRLDRRGPGPGEFQVPDKAGFISDSVWVRDPGATRVNWFDLAGQMIRTRSFGRVAVGEYFVHGGEPLQNGWLLEQPMPPGDVGSDSPPPLPLVLRDVNDSLRVVSTIPQPGPSTAAILLRNGFYSYGQQFVKANPIVRRIDGGSGFFVVEQQLPEGAHGRFTVSSFGPDGSLERRWTKEVPRSGSASEIRDSIRVRIFNWLDSSAEANFREQFDPETTAEAYWVPASLPPVSEALGDSRGYWLGREVFREPRTWERFTLEGKIEARISLPSSVVPMASDGLRLLTRSLDDFDVPLIRLLVVEKVGQQSPGGPRN